MSFIQLRARHVMALLVVTVLQSSFYIVTADSCQLRRFPDGYVCVCHAEHCDWIDESSVSPSNASEVVVVSSSKGGLRFKVQSTNVDGNNQAAVVVDDLTYTPFPIATVTLTVDPNNRRQTMTGFGGAHTGAVTHLLQQLPQSLQDTIYQSYYSPSKGIGYNMMRIPIGGSDFDLEPWAYNELPVNDAELSNFTRLDQRDVDRIAQIKRMQLVTGQNNTKFVGAAWSSPPWMKSNKAWTGFSYLLPQYYQTWANYHVKFLELMSKESIDFWAISTGNEPTNGGFAAIFIRFISLGWTAEAQAKWVGEHLGPSLRNSSVRTVKLLGGDDQRYVFPSRFTTMKNTNSDSLQYLDGFAVHFYQNMFFPPSVLDRTMALFPDKFIINTESCLGDKPWDVNGPILGSWDRAQTYIESFIEDFLHSVVGWIDWNLILDENGGPNYADNTVDSPIIVNIAEKEFYKQPMFYAIGHFSRFITEGSVRIEVRSSSRLVLVVGFKRPDGNTVLVAYNSAIFALRVVVNDGSRTVRLTVPTKSVHTIVY